jgi:putative PIN family toxin of toxin-antitoxin system
VPSAEPDPPSDLVPEASERVPRIVLDTNVVVSGALRRHGSPSAQILDAVTDGTVQLLVDERLMAEYEEVLVRPRLHLAAETVRSLMDELRAGAEHIMSQPVAVVLPDPDDTMFLEVAVAGEADYLVTGNGRHFVPTRGAHTMAVIAPREFVDRHR